MMIVLVAYATCHGSTQGVAERIGRRLQDGGLQAEVLPVCDVTSPTRYDAVVLGSAIHNMRWLPEASEFARDNASLLRQRPTWTFSVSSLGDRESALPDRVARVLRAIRREPKEMTALRSAIRPRGHASFAGAIARTDWNAAGDAFLRLLGGRYGDHRNWAAIDDWAAGIVAELTTAPPMRA